MANNLSEFRFCGTFRKYHNVRLGSGMRTKADVRRPLNLWARAQIMIRLG